MFMDRYSIRDCITSIIKDQLNSNSLLYKGISGVINVTDQAPKPRMKEPNNVCQLTSKVGYYR